MEQTAPDMTTSNNFADLFNKVDSHRGREGVFYVTTTRVNNKPRIFIRTESKYFEITDSQQPITNGHIDDNNGLIPDAIEVSAQRVADLVTESEAWTAQLERIESLLREWIKLRKWGLTTTRTARVTRRYPGKLWLQKKEMSA